MITPIRILVGSLVVTVAMLGFAVIKMAQRIQDLETDRSVLYAGVIVLGSERNRAHKELCYFDSMVLSAVTRQAEFRGKK